MKMVKLIKGLRTWITINKWKIMIILGVVLLVNALGIFDRKEIEGVKGAKEVRSGDVKPRAPPNPSQSISSVVPKSVAHMKWEQSVNFQTAQRIHRENESSRALRRSNEMREEAEEQRLAQTKRAAQRRETARAEAKQARIDARRRKKEDEAEAKRIKKEKEEDEEAEAKEEEGGGLF